MDTQEFLRHVLPSRGFYVATVINPDSKPRQGFFETTDALAQSVLASSARGDNVYYAVSSFAEKGNRKQDNVLLTKSLFLDVDCGEGKPFADWKEGLRALGAFIVKAKLPKPMIVRSGNGLHVYWVLTEELEPGAWKPLAEALKTATKALEFPIDIAVPADSARVLRPVGTVNPKGGRTVALLMPAEPVSPLDMQTALSGFTYVTAAPTPTRRTTLIDNLAVRQEFPPAIASVVASKCQQIAWGVTNQADVKEPFWYAMLGVAAHCMDSDNVAIEWSKDHPQFDQTATLRKLSQWKVSTTGPATCSRFKDERPKGCEKCKFDGRIGTPARLGIQYSAVSVPQTAPDPIAFEVEIPFPYKRTDSGIKQIMDQTDVDVCSFDIYPVGYGYDEALGYETVRYHWNRPHKGWTELSFRQAHLAEGSAEFATSIADKGIVLSSKKQTEGFQRMLRSYMEELRKHKAVTNLYSTMGWKEDGKAFLIGDTFIQAGDTGDVSVTNVALARGTDKMSEKLWGTAGELREWVDASAIIDKANMHAIGFVLGVSASAPLYQFSGIKGVTFNLVGQSGTGKSLAQQWMQSIYGNPDKLHYAARYTQNAVFHRLGMYCNMPMTIDEASMMPDDEVGDFCYTVTQGRDKARLTRTVEEREPRTWYTPVVMSANKPMSAKITSTGMETDAQLLRLLDIEVHMKEVFARNSDIGGKLYGFLNRCYGHAGIELLKYYVSLGPEGLTAMITQHVSEFRKKYGAVFSGPERFWEYGIIKADLGNCIMRDLGLIRYSPDACTEFVMEQIGRLRQSAIQTRMDNFDMLAAYMNEFNRNSLTVMHTGMMKPTFDYNMLPDGAIHVRIDVHRPNATGNFTSGTIMIDRIHFKKWMSKMGGNFTSFMQEIDAQGVDATPRSGKFSFGKDTPKKVGQMYAIGINMSHPRLVGVMNDIDDSVENLTLGELKEVKS